MGLALIPGASCDPLHGKSPSHTPDAHRVGKQLLIFFIIVFKPLSCSCIHPARKLHQSLPLGPWFLTLAKADLSKMPNLLVPAVLLESSHCCQHLLHACSPWLLHNRAFPRHSSIIPLPSCISPSNSSSCRKMYLISFPFHLPSSS